MTDVYSRSTMISSRSSDCMGEICPRQRVRRRRETRGLGASQEPLLRMHRRCRLMASPAPPTPRPSQLRCTASAGKRRWRRVSVSRSRCSASFAPAQGGRRRCWEEGRQSAPTGCRSAANDGDEAVGDRWKDPASNGGLDGQSRLDVVQGLAGGPMAANRRAPGRRRA